MNAQSKSRLSFVARIRVIHPFLLAIFPILFLWSQNIEELSFKLTASDIIVPLAVSSGATLVAFVLAGLLFKSWAKAGLIVSMPLLLFFSYGHVVELVSVETVDFLRHRHILLVWAALFGFGAFFSIRAQGDLRNITRYLNIVGLALLLTTLVSIGTSQINSVSALQGPESSSQASPAATVNDAGDWPDIYFIMLDAYASSRSLKNNMGFDNHEFIDYLESQDFYIPAGGRSNYTNTTLSMASAMNMRLLDDIAALNPGDSDDPSALIEMTRNSEVMDFLRARGYKILHFKNVWMPRTELGYQDLYVGCERAGLFSLGGDGFSVSLIRTTLADPFLTRFGIVQDELRARRLCDFSKFIETIDLPGPKFVFAAFTVPHPPFLFGRNGEPVRSIETSYTVWGSREQYLDQLHYVNQRVEEILDTLLSTPGYSPAVIIQGDHGTWFLGDSDSEDVYRERLQILNAYLLPGGGRELLYDGITPVNSFRVVFNHYFGANYELLADNSYYTNMDNGWYNYLDVTDAVRGAQQ